MNKHCAVCNPEERKRVAETEHFEPMNVLNNACIKHQKVLEKLWQNAIGCLDEKLWELKE
jgi:hypothetical protein